MSAADKVYRKIITSPLVKSKFFANGWGKTETYESLARLRKCVSRRDECNSMFFPCPIHLTKMKSPTNYELFAGKFLSPLAVLSPGTLPPEAEMARFELLVPKQWSSDSNTRPMYIHLAGTGDHYFWRRRTLTAEPLLNKSGVGALLLENPFYGSRKPREQVRSYLLHVSDLMIMGLALILECMVLYHWLKKEGYGPLGITGFSMGGHNASLSSTVWPEPHAIVPCLSWTTASTVFTKGLLSEAVGWSTLQEQLHHSRRSGGSLWNFFKHQLPVVPEENDCVDGLIPSSDSRMGGTENVKNSGRWHSRLKAHVDTVKIMDNLLDYATHLSHFSQPVEGSSAIFVAADGDLYVPRKDDIASAWPKSEVRYVGGGHVSTSIFKQKFVRSVLQEAMNRQLSGVTSRVQTLP